jgi:hypothetical protein
MSFGSPPGWDDLTPAQQQLLLTIQDTVAFTAWPNELRDALHAADAPAADKAAVAKFLGGPGADHEFAEVPS